MKPYIGSPNTSENAKQAKITYSHFHPTPKPQALQKGVIYSQCVNQPVLATADGTVGKVQTGYGFHM